MVPTQSISNEVEFKLFPNPAQDYIYLKGVFAEKFITPVIIRNLAGQELKRYELEKFEDSILVDISEFPSGMYFIWIDHAVQKFIKNQ